jgi:hypothetical protein
MVVLWFVATNNNNDMCVKSNEKLNECAIIIIVWKVVI